MTMTIDTQLAFSQAEYERRLASLRRVMEEKGADILIVDEKEHLVYLTGFGPSGTMYQACIVPITANPIMVLRRLDGPSFLESTWLDGHVMYGDSENPVDVVAATLTEHGWANSQIGFELDSNYLSVQRYQALTAALPHATTIDFSNVLRELRLLKSPQEIEYLQQAANIADEAMGRAVAAVGEGVSERAAAVSASSTFLELGSDSGHVGPIASGSRTDSLHGALRDHPLAKGEILHLELCPQVRGYSARLMRPTIVGEPTAERAETAKLLIEIQDEQLAAMRPGVAAHEVDRIARSGILNAGLRDTYDNSSGYTLGYYGSPYPPRTSDFTRIFVPTAEWRLEPGMVFHMYVAAKGMAFSETVLVTDDGHKRLTGIERRLFTC